MSEAAVPLASPEYWFNTATGQVEEGRQSSWTHLLGPYDSREEAQSALDRARRRSEAWDQEDEEWETGGSSRPVNTDQAG